MNDRQLNERAVKLLGIWFGLGICVGALTTLVGMTIVRMAL